MRRTVEDSSPSVRAATSVCRRADIHDGPEHRLIERRFPLFANRIVYWHIDDIEFMQPSIALAMIDDQVRRLLLSLGSQARQPAVE